MEEKKKPSQQRPRKRLHIYVYPETYAAMQQCAKEELRSISAVYEAASRLYLDMRKMRENPLKFIKEQKGEM